MDKNPHLDGTPEEFIKANMGLAQKVAWGWIPYVQRNENIKFNKEDLVSIAYIGLIKAYDNFNPTLFKGIDGKGVRFSTYAVPMIKGELRRHIRDKGNTIRKSRNGEIIPCDSLDVPIGDGTNTTVVDRVHIESYEIENQVIIKDFLSQTDPRLQKLYKLWSADLNQREIGKSMGISQVQISRLQKQLLDLAKEYGEGGISMANDGTRKMREEITTLEQFNAIGSGGVIARKYGVSSPTAYGFKKQLAEKEKMEVTVVKADAVKMETTPFEIANIPANYEAIEKRGEVTEGTSKQFAERWVDNCATEQTRWLTDVFSGDLIKAELAEPEPPWTPELEHRLNDFEVEKLLDAVKKLETEEDDEELMIEIGGWLKGIRERTIKRAGIKFDDRVRSLMEVS